MLTHPTRRGPAFRYIRNSDRMPTIEQVLDVADPIVKVKLFVGDYTFLLCAYDADTKVAWGAVSSPATFGGYEIGTIDMLDVVTCPWSAPVIHNGRRFEVPIALERDLYFDPLPLSVACADGSASFYAGVALRAALDDVRSEAR